MGVLRRVSLAVAGALLLSLTILAAPVQARSYSVEGVDIDATLAPDGSLEVRERRTFRFEGEYRGIAWEVPRGSYEGRRVEAQVDGVFVEVGGRTVELDQADDRDPETYELSEADDALALTLFFPVADATATFEVDYELTSLATRWADVGELYWQYVPADPGSEGVWQNVRARVHLPVPSGARIVPGDNVRAWGHGPLDGEVAFVGDAVSFFSPGVGTDEFLEARVCFPQEWIGDAPASQEERLEEVIDEEAQWADDANAQRQLARRRAVGIPAGLGLASVGSFIAALVHKHGKGRKRSKPSFDGQYYRDVPSDDHPAVLGMLYHDGQPGTGELSATLMRLADEGRLSLDAVWVNQADKKGKDRQVREWRLLGRGEAEGAPAGAGTEAAAIDDAAYELLFDVVAKGHRVSAQDALGGPAGAPYVLPSFFEEAAKSRAHAYAEAYERWSFAVRRAYDSRDFETKISDGGIFPGILGLLDFAIATALGLYGAFVGLPSMPLAILIICCFAAGIYCVMNNDEAPVLAYTQRGEDLRAKLEALRRWLVDFTHLEEAIPTDVVLWNRLLVMATVLGVADKVVSQLRVALPELLEDERLWTYGWCDDLREADLDDPASSLARSLAAARGVARRGLESSSDSSHSVSDYELSSSRDSSSSGSGGGFSSGGGGGFSGGGRGGAF